MSSSKIAIVDIGTCNLFSVSRAVNKCGLEGHITSKPEEVLAAERLILPGVGAFGEAMRLLSDKGLVEPIVRCAQNGKPIMGICLGMQLLFDASDEYGAHDGLKLVPGRVVRFPDPNLEEHRYKVPQIGWNSVLPFAVQDWQDTILQGLDPKSWFYFIHSYYCIPSEKKDILGITKYAGLEYCSVVKRNNIWGCQFHPERSAESGLLIYQNFLTYK